MEQGEGWLGLPTPDSEVGDCGGDAGGDGAEGGAAEIGSGVRAAGEHDRTNGTENPGVGSRPFLPVLPSHTPATPHPHFFPGGAGLRCGCVLIIVFPPHPHPHPTFHLPGWTAEPLLGNDLCFVLMP